MSIQFRCSCGKELSARDEYAGRKSRCTGCGQIVTIPTQALPPSPAAIAPAPVQPRPASAGQPVVGACLAVDTRSFCNLLDEELSSSSTARYRPSPGAASRMQCPNCREPLPANAVLCVTCGYNLQTGRVMTTRYPDLALAERLEADRREAERREAERLAANAGSQPSSSRRKKSRRSSSSDGSAMSGMLGGIGIMALAVAWFVGGLMVGYIFFYPPILFLIGMCTAFRGLFRMMGE